MKRMGCAEVDSLVDRYADGLLSGQSAALLEAHVAHCARCRERLEGARLLTQALSAGHHLKAPKGFAAVVMDEVFREALWGRKGAEAPARTAVPARGYRRLGFSLVLSAGVLCAVLLTQPLLLPGSRIGLAAPFTRDRTGIVRAALNGADRAVEQALQTAGGSASGIMKGEAQ